MSKTVLIVEDEIFVALDLERILVDAGYNVAGIAADSESAYAITPDCALAFVDVNLRDGPTGPTIAAKLAQDHGVKVVFVTANPTQIGKGDGALGFIRKPFRESAIIAAAGFATGSDQPIASDDLVLIRPATNAG